jgi:hypothetical protein
LLVNIQIKRRISLRGKISHSNSGKVFTPTCMKPRFTTIYSTTLKPSNNIITIRLLPLLVDACSCRHTHYGASNFAAGKCMLVRWSNATCLVADILDGHVSIQNNVFNHIFLCKRLTLTLMDHIYDKDTQM